MFITFKSGEDQVLVNTDTIKAIRFNKDAPNAIIHFVNGDRQEVPIKENMHVIKKHRNGHWQLMSEEEQSKREKEIRMNENLEKVGLPKQPLFYIDGK